MILTGPEITAAAQDGRIHISPFDPDQVNPNSYNVRLGEQVRLYTNPVLDAARPNPTRTVRIGPEGLLIQPGVLYLGHTVEQVGSDHYVPLLEGRSSVGRLGLWVQITAPIGDIGFTGQWTLQLTPVRPLRVYAHMQIGQIMFEAALGHRTLYEGKYQHAAGPRASEAWRGLPQEAGAGAL